MPNTENRFDSTVAGIHVQGQAHSLSAWFVLALRLMMGYAFLHAGWTKFAFVSGEAFDATGYLKFAVPKNGGPAVDTFLAVANTPWLVAIVNVAIPWGEFLIGLGLIVGTLVRLAAFFGALMMAMFYLGNWDVAHGVINGDFAYMLVFLAIGAFAAGRIIGLDSLIENYQIGGERLVERYPKFRYVLG